MLSLNMTRKSGMGSVLKLINLSIVWNFHLLWEIYCVPLECPTALLFYKNAFMPPNIPCKGSLTYIFDMTMHVGWLCCPMPSTSSNAALYCIYLHHMIYPRRSLKQLNRIFVVNRSTRFFELLGIEIIK